MGPERDVDRAGKKEFELAGEGNNLEINERKTLVRGYCYSSRGAVEHNSGSRFSDDDGNVTRGRFLNERSRDFSSCT